MKFHNLLLNKIKLDFPKSIFLLLFVTFLVLNIFKIQIAEEITSSVTEININSESCIEKNRLKNQIINNTNFKVVEIYKNISITDNPRNLFCLGEVKDLEIQDNEIVLLIGKSERFTRFLSPIYFAIILILNLIFKIKNITFQLISSVICLKLFELFFDLSEPNTIFISKALLIFITLVLRKYFIEEKFEYKF